MNWYRLGTLLMYTGGCFLLGIATNPLIGFSVWIISTAIITAEYD